LRTANPANKVLSPRIILMSALMCLMLFFAVSPSTTFAQGPASASSLTPTEQALFQRINEIRVARGLAPFNLDMRLTSAARAHAADMQARRWGSHRGSNGSNVNQRAARAGYPGRAVEAIGWGQTMNVERMINWWMNSPVHRGLLLSRNTDIGIGHVGSGYNWYTLNFGSR
jgi:uncharacterized protein YkwD